MKKNLKKFAAIAATMALTVSMLAMPVFADSTNPTNTGSITLTKGMVVSNPTLSTVKGPGVTFTYAIAPADPSASNGGISITDKNSHTATVYQGPADGVKFAGDTPSDSASIEYPITENLNASAAGTDNAKTVTANGDISKFTHAGIYRYSITEEATGNTDIISNSAKQMYLDVYVINGTDGLEFAGFVMHDGDTENGAPANKTTFDDTTDSGEDVPEGTGDTVTVTAGQDILETAAKFETVNVTLKNIVKGSMGDRTNEFPFAGTIVDKGRALVGQKNSETAAAIEGVAAGSSLPAGTTLKHNDVYTLSGLSKAATVTYTETNNTTDVYKVMAGKAEDDATYRAEADVNAAATAPMSAATPIMKKANGTTGLDGNVVFTNTLDNVSPTGLTMRYGAYFAMLLAAIALGVFLKKTKASDRA